MAVFDSFNEALFVVAVVLFAVPSLPVILLAVFRLITKPKDIVDPVKLRKERFWNRIYVGYAILSVLFWIYWIMVAPRV